MSSPSNKHRDQLVWLLAAYSLGWPLSRTCARKNRKKRERMRVDRDKESAKERWLERANETARKMGKEKETCIESKRERERCHVVCNAEGHWGCKE